MVNVEDVLFFVNVIFEGSKKTCGDEIKVTIILLSGYPLISRVVFG